MSQPSLEGVFAQLAQVDDGDDVANRILDVMNYHGSVGGADPLVGVPSGPGPPWTRFSLAEARPCRTRQAGQGTGRGRGRPPHHYCR